VREGTGEKKSPRVKELPIKAPRSEQEKNSRREKKERELTWSTRERRNTTMTRGEKEKG